MTKQEEEPKEVKKKGQEDLEKDTKVEKLVIGDLYDPKKKAEAEKFFRSKDFQETDQKIKKFFRDFSDRLKSFGPAKNFTSETDIKKKNTGKIVIPEFTKYPKLIDYIQDSPKHKKHLILVNGKKSNAIKISWEISEKINEIYPTFYLDNSEKCIVLKYLDLISYDKLAAIAPALIGRECLFVAVASSIKVLRSLPPSFLHICKVFDLETGKFLDKPGKTSDKIVKHLSGKRKWHKISDEKFMDVYMSAKRALKKRGIFEPGVDAILKRMTNIFRDKHKFKTTFLGIRKEYYNRGIHLCKSDK